MPNKVMSRYETLDIVDLPDLTSETFSLLSPNAINVVGWPQAVFMAMVQFKTNLSQLMHCTSKIFVR